MSIAALEKKTAGKVTVAPGDFILLINQDLNRAKAFMKDDDSRAQMCLREAASKLEHLIDVVGGGPVQLRLNLESP